MYLIALVGQRVVERVAPFATLRDLHLDALMVSIQCWRPLVGLAAHENRRNGRSPAARPPVERPETVISQFRHVVVLAEPGRGCSRSRRQDLRDHGRAGRNLAAVAGIPVPIFGDDAGAGRVMVAAGQERPTRRRAQCSGVEARVARPMLATRSRLGVATWPPKCAPRAVARVVDQHEQDVGCTRRGLDGRDPVGCGIRGRGARCALERGLRLSAAPPVRLPGC